jgi:hypothetical protein
MLNINTRECERCGKPAQFENTRRTGRRNGKLLKDRVLAADYFLYLALGESQRLEGGLGIANVSVLTAIGL